MATKTKKTKKPVVGRLSVMTDEVIERLKTAWCMGCTDTEAAHFAEISPSALYDHISKNQELSDKRDGWKSRPILRAKATIAQNLNDPPTAKWYLERRARDEFGVRTEVTGANGKDLMPRTSVLNIQPNMTPEQIEALARGLGAIDDNEFDLNG